MEGKAYNDGRGKALLAGQLGSDASWKESRGPGLKSDVHHASNRRMGHWSDGKPGIGRRSLYRPVATESSAINCSPGQKR